MHVYIIWKQYCVIDKTNILYIVCESYVMVKLYEWASDHYFT